MLRLKLLAGVAGLTSLALALSMGTAHAANPCDPLTYGAAGDGSTDNTSAIQSAIDACSARGGGIVPLTKVSGQAGTYLTAPIQLKSHVILQLNAGVTLLGTSNHAKYKIAYINWPWQAGEALVSASGAVDVGIIGSGTIDGQGGIKDTVNNKASWWLQAQNYTTVGSIVGTANSNGVSFYLQTSPLNYTYIPSSNGMPRPWLVEFYNCSSVTISGVTLRNSPMWHTVIRASKNVVISGITVSAPYSNANQPTGADAWSSAKNSDAIDLIGAQNVTISNANLSVNDDNIAMKAFFPLVIDGIGPDPLASGLITQNTTNVTITNMVSNSGHGFSIGSETGFGIDHVLIQNVTMNNNTGSDSNFATGIRVKSGRDRGSQMHHLTFQNITMTNVGQPITIQTFYPASAMPVKDTTASYVPTLLTLASTTANTPYIHDVTISNVTATGANTQSNIEGLSESCILRVTLNNVSISQSGSAIGGLALANMVGTFNNVTVSGEGTDALTGTTAQFQPYQNVTVTGAGGNANLSAGAYTLTHAAYPGNFASGSNYASTPCTSQPQQLGN